MTSHTDAGATPTRHGHHLITQSLRTLLRRRPALALLCLLYVGVVAATARSAATCGLGAGILLMLGLRLLLATHRMHSGDEAPTQGSISGSTP